MSLACIRKLYSASAGVRPLVDIQVSKAESQLNYEDLLTFNHNSNATPTPPRYALPLHDGMSLTSAGHVVQLFLLLAPLSVG